MRSFEILEAKRLLTVNVAVVQDAAVEAEVGDHVTRVIRVFTDEATQVRVRSSLENELANPTWERVRGYGKHTNVDSFSSLDFDLRILQGKAKLTPVGDLNGDGRSDFAIDNGSVDLAFIFGGVEDSIRFDFPLDPQVGVVLKKRGSVKALGDVNGDGFDDLVSGNKISFGGSDFASRETLVKDSDISHCVVIDEVDLVAIAEKYVINGQATPIDADFRHAYLPYEGFDGQSGFGFETQDEREFRTSLLGTRWFDVNGDGNFTGDAATRTRRDTCVTGSDSIGSLSTSAESQPYLGASRLP